MKIGDAKRINRDGSRSWAQRQSEANEKQERERTTSRESESVCE